ncbi:MAG TPA: fused MFS/spermidine synthase [Candidatus Limnocylindrales bacterium]|nr:fused MFS/spermidine synthase [Candidatus Limnocylindrales bacterium]
MTNPLEARRSAFDPAVGAVAPAIARPIRAIPPAILFGGSIGLSAFLLFSVEPLVGRLATPVFGGAAGVWATVLAFFQGVLLLGYLYAHILATRLPVRRAAAIHILVVLVAVLATALAPARVADLRDEDLPTLIDLVRVLTILIGPAAFAITSTTPLLSAWYARVRREADPDARTSDPYWLYALSNGGSLVALLAYPLLVEPALGLTAQRSVWLAGLAALAIVLVGAAARAAVTRAAARLPSAVTAVGAPSMPWRERTIWILLAAIPSGLLSAVTNLITTDLIAAPLLWVVPLAIYLASFVVAFSARGRQVMPVVERLAPAAATLLWIPLGSSAGWPILPLLAIEYGGLALLAIALHGRLAQRRPDAAHVTSFYLTMSLGGVLGGLFVAVVAPLAFDGIWEYPILVAGAVAMLAVTRPRAFAPPARTRPLLRLVGGFRWRVTPYAVVAAVLVAALVGGDALATEAGLRWLLVGGLVLAFGGQPAFLAVTTSLVLVLATFILPPAAVFRDRSFFGVTEVLRTDDATVLMHGTTVHGSQWRDPARSGDPGSYYARSGPVGDIFAVWAERPANGSIAVMGLGAGTLAAFPREGDRLLFFEIDEVVARVAADPALFTYLRDTRATTSVRIGDGRLLLAREPAASHDLVMMDAFSSDSIPVHLITVEALEEALRTLRPNGLLAVHVSNRYYDIGPAVATGARRLGLDVVELQYQPTADEARAGAGLAHWLVAARDPADLAGLRARGWVDARLADHPLTDDFADLLRHLRPGVLPGR